MRDRQRRLSDAAGDQPGAQAADQQEGQAALDGHLIEDQDQNHGEGRRDHQQAVDPDAADKGHDHDIADQAAHPEGGGAKRCHPRRKAEVDEQGRNPEDQGIGDQED